MNKATELLENPIVNRNIHFWARRLSGPQGRDQEDICQDIRVELFDKSKGYDPETGSAATYASCVMVSYAHKYMRDNARLKRVARLTEVFMVTVEYPDPRHIQCESRAILRMALDDAENSLRGNAREVFKMLRIGFNRTECADKLCLSRSRITAIVQNIKTHISCYID